MLKAPPIEANFRHHAAIWKKETALTSSLSEMVTHQENQMNLAAIALAAKSTDLVFARVRKILTDAAIPSTAALEVGRLATDYAAAKIAHAAQVQACNDRNDLAAPAVAAAARAQHYADQCGGTGHNARQARAHAEYQSAELTAAGARDRVAKGKTKAAREAALEALIAAIEGVANFRHGPA